jgi:hypothetical protein
MSENIEKLFGALPAQYRPTPKRKGQRRDESALIKLLYDIYRHTKSKQSNFIKT